MSSFDPARPPRAALFGCEGLALNDWERGFFAETDPLGFILFARNCDNPDQTRKLVAALRDAVGRADAPVFIDQEGGRVARLRAPHWHGGPAAGKIAALAERDAEQGAEAARALGRLIGVQLADLGIDVDFAPCLDLRFADAHEVIGDRAFGSTPEQVVVLGKALCDGLLSTGVLPVIKHLPGHGRAAVDSHLELPRVAADLEELRRTDFAAFRPFAKMPYAMTGHVVYEAIDPDRPATLSARVIAEVIRGDIGFEGVLMTDDLSMSALSGTLGERTEAAFAAGCDLAMHCNGERAEMEAVAAASGPMSATAQACLAAAAPKRTAPEPGVADLGGADLGAADQLAGDLDRLLQIA